MNGSTQLGIADSKQEDKEAKLAVEKGKGIMIFGRPCRTEMVKANRKCPLACRSERFKADIGFPRHLRHLQPPW